MTWAITTKNTTNSDAIVWNIGLALPGNCIIWSVRNIFSSFLKLYRSLFVCELFKSHYFRDHCSIRLNVTRNRSISPNFSPWLQTTKAFCLIALRQNLMKMRRMKLSAWLLSLFTDPAICVLFSFVSTAADLRTATAAAWSRACAVTFPAELVRSVCCPSSTSPNADAKATWQRPSEIVKRTD